MVSYLDLAITAVIVADALVLMTLLGFYLTEFQASVLSMLLRLPSRLEMEDISMTIVFPVLFLFLSLRATDTLDVVLVCLFLGEMALKIYYLGPLTYSLDRWNIFDGELSLTWMQYSCPALILHCCLALCCV